MKSTIAHFLFKANDHYYEQLDYFHTSYDYISSVAIFLLINLHLISVQFSFYVMPIETQCISFHFISFDSGSAYSSTCLFDFDAGCNGSKEATPDCMTGARWLDQVAKLKIM